VANVAGEGNFKFTENGYVAFSTVLTGPSVTQATSFAFWLGNGDELVYIARRGDVVPGLPAELKLFGISFHPNPRGQLLVEWLLSGPGGAAGSALWFLDRPAATSQRLLATGDVMRVRAEDDRIIQSFSVFGFNERGETAVLPKFTDGSSGVLVLTHAAGSQLPGDADQDSELGLSDALYSLRLLFDNRDGLLFPCRSRPAGTVILDNNGDGDLDVSDPISLLRFLFFFGPPPALGFRCVEIMDCPPVADCSAQPG
jgi:hypothetical protein